MIAYRAFTKRFGRHLGVDELTLTVRAGETVALLGPNGSGKTTSLKAAAGLIHASTGEVLVGEPGLRANEPAARQAMAEAGRCLMDSFGAMRIVESLDSTVETHLRGDTHV